MTCPNCGKDHPPGPVIASFLGFIGAVFGMGEGSERGLLPDLLVATKIPGMRLHCKTCDAVAMRDDWLNYARCPSCKLVLHEKNAYWESLEEE